MPFATTVTRSLSCFRVWPMPVSSNALQLTDPLDRDAAPAVRHAAAHRGEVLEEPRVALAALAHARVDAVDGHRSAEHGRRRGRIRRRGHIAGNAEIPRADLPRLHCDHVARSLDLHASLAKGRDREIDERR
jgi:hypothetical protein